MRLVIVIMLILAFAGVAFAETKVVQYECKELQQIKYGNNLPMLICTWEDTENNNLCYLTYGAGTPSGISCVPLPAKQN